MLSLEQQIENLADAAFAATTPVEIPSAHAPQRGRGWRIAVAAAIAVGIAVSATVMTSQDDTDVLLVTDQPGVTVEIADPLDIDLSEVVEVSQQQRLNQLEPPTIVDTTALDGFDAETEFVANVAVNTDGEYWQQVSVSVPGGVDLVLNVWGTGGGWGPMDDTEGEPVEVRNTVGRLSRSQLAWLESETVRVEIVGGPGAGVANITEDALRLAEALEFVVAADAWTLGNEDRLGPQVGGDPLLAGTLGGVDWSIVESAGDLVVRSGDQGRRVFSESPPPPDGYSYGIGGLPDAGGVLLYGFTPTSTGHVELLLDDGATVILPAVPMSDGQIAFAVPISDLLDPVEIQMIRPDGDIEAVIDLRQLPPYLGGYSSVGS